LKNSLFALIEDLNVKDEVSIVVGKDGKQKSFAKDLSAYRAYPALFS